MMNKLAVLAATMLIVGGCVGLPGSSGQVYWELTIEGQMAEQDTTQFDGEIGLSGNYGPVTVSDVRLRLLDTNNETMSIVTIGTLNESRPAVNFSEASSQPPAYVLIEVGSIDSPDNMEYRISKGLKRTESGEYEPIE